MSPLAMAEWIEIGKPPVANSGMWSPLAMAEWIEIDIMINAGDTALRLR